MCNPIDFQRLNLQWSWAAVPESTIWSPVFTKRSKSSTSYILVSTLNTVTLNNINHCQWPLVSFPSHLIKARMSNSLKISLNYSHSFYLLLWIFVILVFEHLRNFHNFIPHNTFIREWRAGIPYWTDQRLSMDRLRNFSKITGKIQRRLGFRFPQL